MDELDNILNGYKSVGNQIPLHKQFELRKVNLLLESTSHEQAIAIAKEMYHAMMIREVYYQELLKTTWGLDPSKAA